MIDRKAHRPQIKITMSPELHCCYYAVTVPLYQKTEFFLMETQKSDFLVTSFILNTGASF